MAEQWLSIVEYARTFKVSDMTVRRRIKTGKLHAVLKDGKYYIPIPFSEGGSKRQPQVEIDDLSVHGNYRYEAAPVRQPAQEMQIIKAHPSAAKTIVPPQESNRHHHPVNPSSEREERYSAVPSSLAEPLASGEKTLVDSRALLAYCDATLRKMNELERRTVERFKAKLDAVETTLLLRDNEIRNLKQQVEDLQVLVGILEKKNGR